MAGMNLFVPITKVDVARREVWGRAVQEVVDKVDEIFDYASSKPHFEEWSKSFSDATNGQSLGNIRAMHGKVAAGKIIKIDFNDAAKAIDIGAKIVDDNEWNKVLEGVYTGYSIGGSYVGDKTTEKVDGRDVKRYTAKPSETSLVDNPCVPTAKFFDILKADGTIEKVAFKPAAVNINGTPEEVDEFAKALNDAGLSMADAIKLVKDAHPAKDVLAMLDTVEALKKRDFSTAERETAAKEGDALPDGSFPIKTVQDLKNAVRAYGRAKDKEAAKKHIIARAKALGATGELPDDWKEKLTPADMVKTLKPDEIVNLLLPALTASSEAVEKADEPTLRKMAAENLTLEQIAGLAPGGKFDAVKARAAVLKAKMSTANMDRLQAAHDHLAAMGASCDGDTDKNAPKGDLAKALKTIEEQGARLEKLEKQPMPFVTLRTVPREQDGPTTKADVPEDLSDIKLEAADYVKNADGSIDYATSRIMKAHKLKAKA